MSVARYLTETEWQGKISLILGFRASGDFIFRTELEQLKARNPNLAVTVTMRNPTESGRAREVASIRRCSSQLSQASPSAARTSVVRQP